MNQNYKLFTSPVNLGLLRGEEGALERTLRKKESFEACEPKNPSGKFDKIPDVRAQKQTGGV